MRASGQGMDIKLAKSNIRKQVGSGLFSSLIPLAASIAPTIGKTLGLSALSGLASEGESQIVKAISGNVFLILLLMTNFIILQTIVTC